MKKSGRLTDDNGKTLTQLGTELDDVTKQLDDQKKELTEYNAVTDDLTGKYMESAQGLESLSENFEKWQESINSGDPKEQAEAFANVGEALGKITNMDPSVFDANFIKDNLDLIGQAANGSSEALAQFRMNASQKILVDAGIAPSVESIPPAIQEMLNEAQAICNNDLIEAGATLDPTNFIAGLNAMLEAGQITTAQLASYFDALEGMGVEAYIEEGPTKNLIEGTASMVGNIGQALGFDGAQIHEQVQQSLAVKLNAVKLRKIGNTGSNFSGSHAGGGSGGSGGGGGGGGGGSEKTYEPKTKDPIEEEIDRYEKVQTALDEVDSRIDKLTIDQDRLMGNN